MLPTRAMAQWWVTFRQLLRRPTFALTAVLLLAVGVGINTTVFNVLETVILKPLPYPDADRLVAVMEANSSKRQGESLVAPVRLEEWNQSNHTFTALSGSYSENVTDTSGSTPERLAVLRVSPRYFQVYGRPPLVGRTFNGQEERYGGPGAAVISFGLWNRRFNGDAGAVGKLLVLGNQPYTIVGVMPENFAAPTVEAWLAAPLNPYLAKARDARFLVGIGRMRPNVTIQEARADLTQLQQQLGQEYPETDRGWSAVVVDKKQQVLGSRAKTIWMAFGGTSLLLLLSCINIASLLLGRMYQRERELALRASLGATRWQVAKVILREISVIAAAGCAFGTLLSYWSVSLLAKVFANLPRIGEVEFDGASVLFAAGMGLMFVLSLGLLPVLQSRPSRLANVLAQGGRSLAPTRHPLQRSLLVGQFALTVVLLGMAGLLLRSYYELSNVKTGFDPQNVVTFHVGAEWSEDRVAIGRLQEEILAELGRQPGVQAVGMTNFLPTDEATLRYQYQLAGVSESAAKNIFTAGARTVSPGYLTAMRVPILQGRSCPELTGDWKKAAKALVNEAFVRQFAGGANLVGTHVSVLGTDVRGMREISGVLADVREDSANLPATPYVYLCANSGGWPDPEYVVRAQGSIQETLRTVRQVIHRLAPNRAIFGLQTMNDHVAAALGQPLLMARLLTGFAMAALLLAAFGLYSLTMLTVTAQTREIGTRIALGAYSSQVIAEVFAQAARLMMAGLAIGLAGAIAAGQTLRSFLFGVSPTDPMTLLVVGLILIGVCSVATLLPALRAASIDPIEALRSE